jgi:signal transduction histidine kinase/DNA-binding response OmpR family regulator
MTQRPAPILVIDDEPEIRAILAEYLAGTGFAVATAGSAEEGAVQLSRQRFHGLILDLNLPGQDGLAFLETVRRRAPELSVLIITGYATADSAIEALRLGADDYLQKPFELDALGRALGRALGSRRLRRENRALVHRLQRMNRALDQRRQELADRVAEATRHLRLLLDSARDLNKDLDLEDTLTGVVEQAARLVRARLALVFLRDPGSDRFDLEAAVTSGGEPPPAALSFRLGEGIAGRAVLFGRPLVLAGRCEPADPLHPLDLRSALAVPMIREGTAAGVLVLIDRQLPAGDASDRPAEFSAEDEEMALTLAAHAALAIRNAQIYAEARRLDRLQSEFVAAVSHELRTPLTQMKAALEIVDTYYNSALDIRGRDLLAISEAAVRTLEDQVELILASAEIETDALTLDLISVPAREIADEAAGRLLPVAARRGIRIEIVGPEVTTLVHVDRRRFVRALANLLSNAVKFSDSGQAVRLEVEAEAGLVRFHVIDRGIGIDPRDQAHIFHRFAQLDGSLTRRTGGTGLGLSVSRALVERHGGQILLRSRPGEGSRFTIEIPSAEAARPAERADPLADVA